MHPTEDELKFHCDQCPKKFAKKYMLEFHKGYHIPIHERKYVCEECPNK